MPEKARAKPALFIFVHGGFWLLSDDEYQIGPAIAANLVSDRVAVALVRYRLAPAHRHPAQAEDVAAAVGHLINHADKYGFDAKRVYLAGPREDIWPRSWASIGVISIDNAYRGRRWQG